MTPKYILYGVLIGALVGLFWGIIGIAYSENYSEMAKYLVIETSKQYNVSESEISIAIKSIENTMRYVTYLLPISGVINGAILGVIAGGFTQLFADKLRIKPTIAAFMGIMVLFFILAIIIYYTDVYTGGLITSSLTEYLPLWYVLGPYLTYVILFMVFCSIKGPWESWVEAPPKNY
ncbi:MAG TPA: hypothetical protein ENK81_00995 [Euryarchaeota archaeon]|nr:hypothetical protein [Euryarchaeota archaeon]